MVNHRNKSEVQIQSVAWKHDAKLLTESHNLLSYCRVVGWWWLRNSRIFQPSSSVISRTARAASWGVLVTAV